jgi:hypothetical protein
MLTRTDDREHFVLALQDGAVLGDVLARLAAAELQILTCTEERSSLEHAFLHLVRPETPS